MNDNFRISFDYDSTLDRDDVQAFAKKCVERGIDAYIVTSRQSTERALEMGHHWVKRQNQQLYDVAAFVGIPVERIIFTEHIDKIEYLKDKNFVFHLDDDMDELTAITESGDACIPVCVENDTWKKECVDAIRKRSTENFMNLVDNSQKSTFIEDVKWMKANKYWTKTGFEIQLNILEALDNMDSNLDEMCDKIDIDRKCCSGPYDFKLSELKRIEKYLNIKLKI